MHGGEYMRNLLQGLLKIIYEKPINWGGGGDLVNLDMSSSTCVMK